MLDFQAFNPHVKPFSHWVADDFVDRETVRAVNAAWPQPGDEGWRLETGVATTAKGSMLFPRRLPAAAQALAEELTDDHALRALSIMARMELHPDPWMHEGPLSPALGGGLHEIHRGGTLGVHVDFERHPSGLRRVANLLIYLNEDWQDGWGGKLGLYRMRGRLDLVKSIAPVGGRAVFFVTTPESWHGHPEPLACPQHRSRRSLALYYYSKDAGFGERAKTVYQR